jgi:dUTP pyrophosphatase
MKISEDYFQKIDNCEKAYLLGKIVFNINEIDTNQNDENIALKIYDTPELNIDCFDVDDNEYATINSSSMIKDILNQTNMKVSLSCNNSDISYFIARHERKIAIEYIKAYFEKHGYISVNNDCVKCNITCYNKENLEIFAKFFGIPYKEMKLFNLSQIVYSGVNVLDLLGIIYSNVSIVSKSKQYTEFIKLLKNEKPSVKVLRIDDLAIVPTKANFSDVGHDVTIIGVHKKINSKTSMYKTGIKLDIPVGYYVEIVPRSSIIKSGYMLANSIGIIDCSYKGELFVALTKIDDESPDITFPFKCVQLITRKQVFSDMVESYDIESSKRDNGGFGSSDQKEK